MIDIELTSSEMWHAALVGVSRQVQNLVKGRQDRYGAPAFDAWGVHICGALGELVVAKYLGTYWTGMGALGNLRASDVGSVEVRWRKPGGHCLLLHERDLDDRPFVLVSGEGPVFTLHGWILGRNGKLPQYWEERVAGRPAFFVPQEALTQMDLLRASQRRDRYDKAQRKDE